MCRCTAEVSVPQVPLQPLQSLQPLRDIARVDLARVFVIGVCGVLVRGPIYDVRVP